MTGQRGDTQCGLRNDGTVECWGDDRWWPYQAPSGQFAAVAAGAWYTCGLRPSGAIECWGHKSQTSRLVETLVDDERLDAPDGQFAAISASASYACGLRTNGIIECWGLDPYGWGTLEPPNGRYDRFTAISAGVRHACALRYDGTAACWGDNRVGQANPPSGRFAAVSAGLSHSCGLRDNWTAECWGSNYTNQSDPPEDLFTEVSAGGTLSCGLRSDKTTVCWGHPKFPFTGEIDVHVFYCASKGAAYSDADLRREIIEISANVGEFYRTQSSGLATLNFVPGGVVSPDHIQWDSGEIHDGQKCRSAINELGDYRYSLVLVDLAVDYPDGFYSGSGLDTTAYSATLEARYSNNCSRSNPSFRVRDLSNDSNCLNYDRYYSVIAHELGHSVFNLGHPTDCSVMSYICIDNTTIGCDSAIRLGWPNFEDDCSREQQRREANRSVFTFVRVGGASLIHGLFYCGLRTDQTISCWGPNWEVVSGVPLGTFTELSLGRSYACGLGTDRAITCWGRNNYGQTDAPSGTFTAVYAWTYHACGIRTTGATECWGDQTILKWKSYSPGGQFTDISAGDLHWCGLRNDQIVACDGGIEPYDHPQAIDPPNDKFTHVFAHSEYSCGLNLKQDLICWGGREVIEAEPTDSQFTAITAGIFHTCGLRTGQTVTCWIHDQDHNHKRLGQDFSQEIEPSGRYTSISAGDTHTCGLRIDQTVTCWGDNRLGQADPPEGQFTAVSARSSTTCGLRIDQTVTCWGDNRLGQADPPEGQFTAVSMGGGHGCALRTDNTVTCWGQNVSGIIDAPAGQFTAIASGWYHSCGIRVNRTTITCWGTVPE